jgi:hypothetical protein
MSLPSASDAMVAVHVGKLALIGGHAVGGIAFDMLNRPHAFAHGHDVHVLVQILCELQVLQGWLPCATLWQVAQALGLTLV